jgi:putative membrane protein
MVDDHSQANEKLKETVNAENLSDLLPKDSLDAKHQDTMDKLEKADAARFDGEYVKAQKKAHEEAVTLFREYVNRGDNAGIRQFATQTLPTLEKHQEHAKRLP